jgi:hypothetical protein
MKRTVRLRFLPVCEILNFESKLAMINGEPVAVADLCQLASTAMRLSARLGVKIS